MSSINQEFLPLYRIQSFGKICRYAPYFLIKDYTYRSMRRCAIFQEFLQKSSQNLPRIFQESFFFFFFLFPFFSGMVFYLFAFVTDFSFFYLFFVFSGISQFPFFVFLGIVFIFFRCVPEVSNLFYFFFRVLKLKVLMLFWILRKVYALFLRNINIVLSSDLNALKIVDYSRD